MSATNADGSTGCARATTSDVTKVKYADYIPHHQPFQYYASTANPQHKRPSSVAAIGTSDDGGANHQYDMTDFDRRAEKRRASRGQLPQGAGLSGRPRRLFRSARRADLRRRDHQRAGAIAGMAATPRSSSFGTIRTAGTITPHKIVNPSAVKGYDVLNGGRCGTGDAAAGRDRQAGAGPLRLRRAPASARDLALRQGQLSSITR